MLNCLQDNGLLHTRKRVSFKVAMSNSRELWARPGRKERGGDKLEKAI